MKSIVQALNKVLHLFVMVVIVIMAGCEDPVKRTEVEKATDLLIGKWIVQQVIVDGVDRTSLYKDLSVTFNANNLIAINGGALWPAITTWEFTDESAKTILRGDGLTITVNALTKTKFVAGLTWAKSTLGGGSNESVPGQHIFTFVK